MKKALDHIVEREHKNSKGDTMDDKQVSHYVVIIAVVAIVALFGFVAFAMSFTNGGNSGGAYYAPANVADLEAQSYPDESGGTNSFTCKPLDGADEPQKTGNQLCQEIGMNCAYRISTSVHATYTSTDSTCTGETLTKDTRTNPSWASNGGCDDQTSVRSRVCQNRGEDDLGLWDNDGRVICCG